MPIAIGKGSRLRVSNMNLGPNSIQWCDSFEYLGVTFHAGLKLKTNTEVIKQKFFMASNSVIGNSRSLDELIQLQLLHSACLFYSMQRVQLNCPRPKAPS